VTNRNYIDPEVRAYAEKLFVRHQNRSGEWIARKVNVEFGETVSAVTINKWRKNQPDRDTIKIYSKPVRQERICREGMAEAMDGWKR